MPGLPSFIDLIETTSFFAEYDEANHDEDLDALDEFGDWDFEDEEEENNYVH